MSILPFRLATVLPVLFAAMIPIACKNSLSVDYPDVATPGTVSGPSALPLLYTGAFSELAGAFSGPASDALINYSGLLTDELASTEFVAERVSIDRRQIIEGTQQQFQYSLLAEARASAERVAQSFGAKDPTNPLRARSFDLAGYAYVLFAENYCSGVPFSEASLDGSITYGAPETTNQILARAIARFDSAVVLATAADTLTQATLNLAQLGKARALLDSGDFAAAAAAAASVPDTFVFRILYSANTNNGIYVMMVQNASWTVANREGGNGLPFVSDSDPRVALEPRPAGGGGSTSNYIPVMYANPAAPVVLGDGIEARLIEAEAKLKAGDEAGSLAVLNRLRSDPVFLSQRGITTPLLPLSSTGSASGDQAQLFKERAYWLFLTDHRLGDLRRLVRQYGLSADSVFPSGVYPRGGSYGNDVSLPLPSTELNNPKAAPCDPTKA